MGGPERKVTPNAALRIQTLLLRGGVGEVRCFPPCRCRRGEAAWTSCSGGGLAAWRKAPGGDVYGNVSGVLRMVVAGCVCFFVVIHIEYGLL